MKKIISLMVFFTLMLSVVAPTAQANAATIDVKSVAGNGCGNQAIIDTDGVLWISGENRWGQLGDGTTTSSVDPIQIMTGVKDVALGRSTTVALKTDGSVWVWGFNVGEELGVKTPAKATGGVEKADASNIITTPTQLLTGAKDVAAGDGFMMALKTDGSLWGWGSATSGAFCIDASKMFKTVNGKTEVKNYKPTKIMNDVKSVSIGLSNAEGSHVVVVKTDGSLWGWGKNLYGTLGEDTTTGLDIKPKEIMDSGVKSVSASQRTTAILKTNGNLYMCGDNRCGQLGLGYKDKTNQSTTRTQAPVKVLSGIKAVSALDETTLALKADGSLLVFGFYKGKCILTPTEIVDGIASLGVGTCAAVKTDGTLWYGRMW